MGFHETAAAVMLGNILAASAILAVVRNWDKEWANLSWWTFAAYLAPIAYLALVFLTY